MPRIACVITLIGALAISVVFPSRPGRATVIDFNTLLDGTPTDGLGSVGNSYIDLGVRFRSKDDFGPSFTSPGSAFGSRSTAISDNRRPPNGTFNILVDFASSVSCVSADVMAAVGRSVRMIAKDASGTILGSVVSSPDTANTFPFKGRISLSNVGAIRQVRWDAVPDPRVASVGIDNLAFSRFVDLDDADCNLESDRLGSLVLGHLQAKSRFRPNGEGSGKLSIRGVLIAPPSPDSFLSSLEAGRDPNEDSPDEIVLLVRAGDGVDFDQILAFSRSECRLSLKGDFLSRLKCIGSDGTTKALIKNAPSALDVYKLFIRAKKLSIPRFQTDRVRVTLTTGAIDRSDVIGDLVPCRLRPGSGREKLQCLELPR